MKKLLAILVAMVLALSVACVASAETDSQLNAVLEKGELVVGCSPVVEGVCYQDPASGEYVGMIPDLINGYAAELGVSVRWEPLEWSTLIASANNGTVDMIAAHMTMTVMRTASITFTEPWISDCAMACVRSDATFTSLDDLNNKDVKIGSGEGSSYNELIPQLFPEAELVILPTTAWQDALATGRIDAMFDDSISFPGPISRSEGKFKLLEDRYGAFLYGFGVPLNDQIFADSLNVYLKTVKTNGTYGDIYQKWFGIEWPANADGASF